MSTDGLRSGKLPVRDFLKMGVSLLGVVVTRAPKPVYRLVFRISMLNESGSSVRLMGRKWTLRDASGNTRIIEGADVFNDTPVLVPGAVFSYGGYQDFERQPVAAEVRYFGVDQSNRPFISPPLVFPKRALTGHE